MPLPDRDFDTTEVAVPWRVLTDAGHEVAFATEGGGATPACDQRLLDGVLFGRLGADPDPIAFYEQLLRTPEFRKPSAWGTLAPADFDGLILPGGHAPGMASTWRAPSFSASLRHSGALAGRLAQSAMGWSC